MMNIKTTAIAIILALGLPLAAKADTNKYENYQVGCDSSAECSNFNVNFEQQSDEAEVAQGRRTRTRRTRAGSDSKIYVGGSLAPFFPFDDELDIGFGGGLFAGYKLTRNISVEVDVFDYFGGLDDEIEVDGSDFSTDDSGYNLFGAAANGIYRFYLKPNDSRSLYIFAGLGVGIGVSSITGDIGDALDDAGLDTADTGFLFQGKGGVGYPLTNNIDLFGQTRFFRVLVEGDDPDGVALDFGASFNF